MDEKNDKKVKAETAATAEKTAAEAEPEPETAEGETAADEALLQKIKEKNIKRERKTILMIWMIILMR